MTLKITPTEQIEFDRQMDAADTITDQVMGLVEATGEDVIGVLYSHWCNVTRILAALNWTPATLRRDAYVHAKEGAADAGGRS